MSENNQSISIRSQHLKGPPEEIKGEFAVTVMKLALWAEYHRIGVNQAGYDLVRIALGLIEDPGGPDDN